MLPIYLYGHPVLREVAQDITPEYPNLSGLIAEMWKSMYESDGIGLAAPQIGKSIRLLVIDASPMAEYFPECKIEYLDEQFNPQTRHLSGFAARVVQHEYDHLEGKLFTDHVSTLRKSLLKNKLARIASGKAYPGYPVVAAPQKKGMRR